MNQMSLLLKRIDIPKSISQITHTTRVHIVICEAHTPVFIIFFLYFIFNATPAQVRKHEIEQFNVRVN